MNIEIQSLIQENFMYKNILCAIDGSTTSNAGLQEAIHLAKDLNATLRLIHVVDMYVPMIISSMEFSPDFSDDVARENGKKLLHNAITVVEQEGVTCDSRMIESKGKPVSGYIVDYAAEWPADLIVLGTHGLKGIYRLVMGSDAENVVRYCNTPVLLVKEPNSPQHGQ